MESDRAYLDYKVKTFTKAYQRSALKMGLLLSSFFPIIFGLAVFIKPDLLDWAVMSFITGFVTVFGCFTLATLTAENTLGFTQDIAREHQEAMARS